MEKDAAGYPQGHTNPGTSRTSPAAYPTALLEAFTGVVAGIRPLREEDQHCGKP